MSSTNLLKVLLLLFVAFAIGEIVFTIQRYGFPQIDLFKPRPGSCKILEEKFCSRGKFFKYNDVKYIAFKDLPVRSPLFSPVSGQRTIIYKVTPPSPFQGSSLLSVYPIDRSATYTFIGNINLPDSPIVKKGESIGSISDVKTKIFGEYTLIFTITRPDASGKPTVDEESLKALFPKIQ